MASPREAFCDYFYAAPTLLRLNIALLGILLVILPFQEPGSASEVITLFGITILTVTVVGLGLCNWYCDWGHISSKSRDTSE